MIGTPRNSKEIDMRIKPIAAGAAALFALTLTACGTNEMAKSAGSSSTAPMTTAMQTTAVQQAAARMGEFAGLGGKHVSGSAAVNGSTLEFTNFSSDEGPDLHAYLANGSSESDVAARKQISTIKFDQASQSFSLSGVDVGNYSTVVINCDKAKAVFGAASLK
ncbi:DM13 domain-containing protein [Mycobacterium sp. CBMA293]|nr:DM13 domain-containing protein [Mycolicibacterium sp. CBMA 360]MUL58191.1 DM13 domain-containing protein [Mycolicibacterium sp. CBMA 335]MUL73649.1 DM13 domain-containing protein [Mycolicibacterium sp. CBMA 311]MUL93074.1 DM13 domain-containing protein [Mycolicibacterium sp. CBMA 230]MUM07623.1 hypothetical protein [Mycolicibacterium sp. CBMA 213]MUM09917.1 DM13 domain-containing protein [Mycolicibacterium sp. CBMA 293]MUM35328.1 DM13 domain-containing protein [Mycolicibacterium sp. CBMA 3